MNLKTVIEETLSKAEEGKLEAGTFFQALATTQAEIFTFLFDDDTRLLNEQEHDYMLFLAMVIIQVLRDAGCDLDAIDIDALDDMSEHAWGLLDHTSIENITESLTDHPSFELYSFLEDACAPVQEHEILSDSAVELVYVKCKALIDTGFLRS